MTTHVSLLSFIWDFLSYQYFKQFNSPSTKKKINPAKKDVSHCRRNILYVIIVNGFFIS